MRFVSLSLALALSLVTVTAGAQEAAPAAALPPPSPAADYANYAGQVPPGSLPPPWISPLSAHELERRGHQKKVAGAALIIIGSALTVGGIVLAAIDADKCNDHPCGGQSVDTLYLAGLAMEIVGNGGIIAGIPTYIAGGVQMAHAHRLELRGFAAAPLSGPGGVAGASANASFRF